MASTTEQNGSFFMSTDSQLFTTNSTATTTVPTNGFVSDNEALVVAIFLNIIATLGIVGNSVVIIAVAFSRKLQTITNVFVIALSVTDLLVCITLPFQSVALLTPGGWLLPDWICASIGGLTSICFGASVILLVLIAVNRYCVITRPRSTCRRFYKTRNLAAMVTCAYIYTFIMFVILPVAGIGQLGYSQSYRICAWDEDHPLGEINDYIVALTFGVSFVIIVFCYLRIFIFVRRHHKNMMNHNQRPSAAVENDFSSIEPTETNTHSITPNNAVNSNITEGRKTSKINKIVSKREVEITKNLFYVICSFFICIAPYSVCLAIPNGASAFLFSGILLMTNACINPIIYSFKHPTFKVVIRYMVKCQHSSIPKPSAALKRLLGCRGTKC